MHLRPHPSAPSMPRLLALRRVIPGHVAGAKVDVGVMGLSVLLHVKPGQHQDPRGRPEANRMLRHVSRGTRVMYGGYLLMSERSIDRSSPPPLCLQHEGLCPSVDGETGVVVTA